MAQITCYDRAKEWVHLYAAGGAAIAVAPIPVVTTGALVAAETHMVYWIAKIYGEELTAGDAVVVLGGLSLGGTVLKAAALEACNFIPIAGWLVKSAIAASAIEGIGHVITKHFEDKYPRKIYTVDPDVESSVKRR